MDDRVKCAAFMGGQGVKARSIAYCNDGTTPTLKSAPSGSNTVPDVVIALNDQRGRVMDVSDKAGTLRAHEHGHQPIICIQGGGTTSSGNQTGSGFSEGGVAYTVNTIDKHAVCYAIGVDQQGGKSNCGWGSDVMPTLCSDSHGTPHAVCYEPQIDDRAGCWVMSERQISMMCTENVSNSVLESDHKGPQVVCFAADARGNLTGGGARTSTITGDHQNRVTDYTTLVVSRSDGLHDIGCFQNTGKGWWKESQTGETLRCHPGSWFENVVVDKK